MEKQTQLVNLGCGATCHPAWINLDVDPRVAGVQPWDVRAGLPFPDSSVDAVYASHLLEHLAPEYAEELLRDMHRVIRLQGTVRLVVPDLEAICRAYLETLDAAWRELPGAAGKHEWMVIELLDQIARSESGGRMAQFLSRVPAEERAYVVSRIGMEAERFWAENSKSVTQRALDRLRHDGPRWAGRRVRRKITEWLVQLVGGRDMRLALQEGVFRRAGEPHRWMYDRVSLRELLSKAGFASFRLCDAWTSAIPGFADYELDTSAGVVRKPDSIFVEARKI